MTKNFQSGFSLMEATLGIALTAIVSYLAISMTTSFSNQHKKFETQVMFTTDSKMASLLLLQDLRASDPSYNNLLLKDDNGSAFFDYYPDLPQSALGNKASRTLTLSLNPKLAAAKEVLFLTQDPNAGPMLVYDPVAAYDIGAPPADPNLAATITFVSLNRSNWISAAAPNFWKENQLLMLDTQAALRPIPASGAIDLTIPPRSPIYAGRVSKQSLLPDGVLTPLLNTQNPQTNTSIGDADTFLRAAPSVGGGQPLIRLRAVKLVRYYLEHMPNVKNRSAARLYKTFYTGNGFSTPFMVTDNVKSIQFTRSTVTQKSMYFSINYIETTK